MYHSNGQLQITGTDHHGGMVKARGEQARYIQYKYNQCMPWMEFKYPVHVNYYRCWLGQNAVHIIHYCIRLYAQ